MFWKTSVKHFTAILFPCDAKQFHKRKFQGHCSQSSGSMTLTKPNQISGQMLGKPFLQFKWQAVDSLGCCEKEGLVQFDHCTSMSGLGQMCSHVGAIPYALIAAVNSLRGTTCTDEACVQHNCKKRSLISMGLSPG